MAETGEPAGEAAAETAAERLPGRALSLRLRITLAFGASAIVLAAVLAATTFLAVRSFLEDQRVDGSTQSTFNTILTAQEYFIQDPNAEPEELVALLQRRRDLQALVIQRGDYFATSFSLTPISVPDGLRDLVSDEQVGYEFTRLGSARVLSFGAPLPPRDTDMYVFYSLSDIDETLSLLLRVLVVVCFLIVLTAILIAQRVGARIVRPLGELSTATRRVAEGLLETRVTAATPDEIGVLAASFNEMADAMQRMIERERRFVANVSHELRTPLATLRTASEVLATHRHDFSSAGREAVDLIVEDVSNLRRLIEELMEVSEVDAGRAIIRWEDVDLRALTEAIVRKTRREIPIDGERVVTVSDKARLERILANLIDNAFEHGGGSEVRIAVQDSDETCSIAITDAGPGIPPEETSRLFDRFYKADSSRTRERGGIGLGLAIASENARLLGGSLEVQSKPGETTFTLRLPHRREGEELS